jgi:hypothetical protein
MASRHQGAASEFVSVAKIGDRLQIAHQNTHLWAALTEPIWCLSPIFTRCYFETQTNSHFGKDSSKITAMFERVSRSDGRSLPRSSRNYHTWNALAASTGQAGGRFYSCVYPERKSLKVRWEKLNGRDCYLPNQVNLQPKDPCRRVILPQ